MLCLTILRINAFAQTNDQQLIIKKDRAGLKERPSGLSRGAALSSHSLLDRLSYYQSRNFMLSQDVPPLEDSPSFMKQIFKKSSKATSRDQFGTATRYIDLKYRQRLANAMISNFIPAISEDPLSKKKVQRESNARISEDQSGDATRYVELKYKHRLANAMISNFIPAISEDPLSKKKVQRESNARISEDQSGDATRYVELKYKHRLANAMISNFIPGSISDPMSRRNTVMESNNRISAFVPQDIPDPMDRKRRMQAKSEEINGGEKNMYSIDWDKKKDRLKKRNAELAAYESGNTLSREAHKSMMQAKSEEINGSEKIMYSEAREKKKERLKKRNAEFAAFEAGNTLSRADHKSMMEAKNKEITEGEKNDVTLGRKEYRRMLKAKNSEITASQKGNTMDRKAYRNMLEEKSAEIAGIGKVTTLSVEDRISKMKEKSKSIADYQAGYLNTAAERRARIRSFFFPGQYQANTPSEKLKKMRSKSEELAKYSGVLKARKYNKRMHPSARYLGKYYLASMSERSDFHRKTTLELARSRRDYMPVYLKKRPEKPRYNRDVEKGIWAE